MLGCANISFFDFLIIYFILLINLNLGTHIYISYIYNLKNPGRNIFSGKSVGK